MTQPTYHEGLREFHNFLGEICSLLRTNEPHDLDEAMFAISTKMDELEAKLGLAE